MTRVSGVCGMAVWPSKKIVKKLMKGRPEKVEKSPKNLCRAKKGCLWHSMANPREDFDAHQGVCGVAVWQSTKIIENLQ